MNYFEDIKEAAEDMFGTDNVDLQGESSSHPKLVIHWDEIEVSNENDERHTIYDLFARVNFNSNASMIGFELARSTLTVDELKCGYVFSHVNRLRGSFIGYSSPCLGTGPIRSTITTLSSGYDSDIFRLFLVELNRYVRTESLSGGPYIRMREISVLYSTQYFIPHINLNVRFNSYTTTLYEYIMKTNPIKPVSADNNTVDFGQMIPFVCMLTERTLDYLRHKKGYTKGDINTYLTTGSFVDGMIYINNSVQPLSIEPRTGIYFKGKYMTFKKVGDDTSEESYVVKPDVTREIISMLYRDYFLGKMSNEYK